MIREIYYGDFRPSDSIESKEYNERRKAAYKLYKKFTKKHPKTNKELEKLLRAHMDMLVVGIEEGYVTGFSDGISLIIEIIGRNSL